jgi:hypothetical protein
MQQQNDFSYFAAILTLALVATMIMAISLLPTKERSMESRAMSSFSERVMP